MGSSQSKSGSSNKEEHSEEIDCQELVVTNPSDGFAIPCKLWTNNNTSSIRSVVLFIHGGMFSKGDCNSHREVTLALVQELGLAVLTTSFRDGSKTTYTEGKASSDLESCANYLYSRYPNHPLGVVGSNSGGWFALNLCNSTSKIPIQFCVPICPVANPHARAVYLKHCIDSTTPLASGKDLYPSRHSSERANEILMNQLQFFQSFKHMAAAADDVRNNRRSVPTLLILGSADANVPPQAVQAVQQGWARRTLVLGEGAGHEIQTTPPTGDNSYLPDIDRFLASVLKESSTRELWMSKTQRHYIPWCS